HLCWRFPGTAAAGAPGTDSSTCPGDSGGPLFMNFGSGLRVAGVTSGGRQVCHDADIPFDTDVFVNKD
ncbi:MAG: trypsin-like serine protease, partial [Desulfuromonadales bacterium]|nr:trypsin-like serine protease [Desulfuromonadales bacterium]